MATKYRGSDAQVRALDAYIKLMRASEALSARIHRHLAVVDLTPSQFGVLEALLHLGPLCQRDLGEKILKSGGNVTMVVDNLERRGLVRRERSSDDRRYVSVHLTEAGDALIREVFPTHVEVLTAEMAALTADEQDALARLCRKLGRRSE